MAAELPRPGVEVIQEFRSVSPTVISPTLVPCVVGVCKQIVDAVTATGSGSSALNSQALVTLPAFFLAAAASGTPPKYTGLDTLPLVFSVNHGVDVTVTFADATASGLTPTSVVAQVRKALAAAGVTSVTAETVGTDSWRLRTVGVGEFQVITISAGTDPIVASTFGIAIGKTYLGLSAYDQHKIDLPQSNFPDPRNNLAQLEIENDTVRVFLSQGGGGLRELLRTQAFLRRGGSKTGAVVTGTVDLTTLTYDTVGNTGTLDGDSLTLAVDGGTNFIVSFGTGATSPANAAGVVSKINTASTTAGYGNIASLDGNNHLVLTSPTLGSGSSVKVVSGSSTTVADLGLTVGTTVGVAAVSAVDDGNGDSLTPLIKLNGATLTTSGAVASKAGTVDVTAGGLYGSGGTLAGKTLTLSDGRIAQTYTFPSGASALVDSAALLTALNGFFGAAAGGGLVFTIGSTHLVITTTLLGDEGLIDIVGGNAVTVLGHVVGKTRGTPFPPAAGDELWVDGALYGVITQVAPGAAVDTVKVNKQVAINVDVGDSWYIVAKSLTGAETSTRPSAEIIVDLTGTVTIKHELLRDTMGAPITAKATIYLQYHAVRLDVSALGAAPGLLKFNSTTDVQTSLSPISTLNPLALGLYFALLNAPGIQVTGLGVDAIAADAPFGTVEAFTRAAEFLEAFEVYAIAPLTHDETVGQVFSTHVTSMSEPENKGERVVLHNPANPTTKVDKIVVSGTEGQSVPSQPLQFDTGAANISALLLAAGIDPTGTIAATDGVFLDIAADDKKYSVESVSGSVVTIRTTFAAGENDDGFYATTDLATPPLTTLIDEPYAVRIRGASLTNPDGTPDKEGMAETMQAVAQTYLNRRYWRVVPDKCAATINGLEQQIDGFYMCAGIAGMIGQQPPQQSFTNFPMTGFTQVIGSNDFFTEKQLNVIAAGGNYIVVQDAEGAPLISRMALTTDMTSIETRTDSINKVVDFTAKFLRRGLKNFIGRFNITQGFLDSLGHVIQGLLGFLTESGVLIGAHLNNLIQDESTPDTVLVDITLDVPFPCNYIRLTLVV